MMELNIPMTIAIVVIFLDLFWVFIGLRKGGDVGFAGREMEGGGMDDKGGIEIAGT